MASSLNLHCQFGTVLPGVSADRIIFHKKFARLNSVQINLLNSNILLNRETYVITEPNMAQYRQQITANLS